MHYKIDQTSCPRTVAVGSLLIPTRCLPMFALAASAVLARARAAGIVADAPPLTMDAPADNQDITNWRVRRLAARYRLSGTHAATIAALAFAAEPRAGER